MGRPEALTEARKLKACLLKAGVPEVSIELMEGRPAAGDRWNNQFVVSDFAHHTVSRYTPTNLTPCLALVKRGRTDVPGPLCNGYGGWDLTARIITLGYANHPGEGGPLVVPSGVEKPLTYTIPKDSARRYAFGWEFEGGLFAHDWDRALTNPRNNKQMTMHEFMARCLNGTQDMYDLPLGAHAEHSTWTTRKVDRLGYTRATGIDRMRQYRPEPPAPVDRLTATVATANIRNTPDLADKLVRADVARVGGLSDWALFQEIGEKEDHVAIDEMLGDDWNTFFPGLAVPMATQDRYRVVRKDRIKLHDGRAGITPARWLSWVTFDGGLVLMNTHWVSGAWTATPRPQQPWRRKMWMLSWQTTAEKIRELNAAGHTVLFGGDFNKRAVEDFTPKQKWLAQHGIDKIGVCPAVKGGTVVATGKPRTVNLHSDHDALIVPVAWR